jgi:hypothetical protein
MTTLGFPPVDAAVYQLSKIEYKKHLQTFLHAVITIAAFVAAVYTVLATKYKEHDGNQKLMNTWNNFVLGCIVAYTWVRYTLVPELRALYSEIISLKNRFF